MSGDLDAVDLAHPLGRDPEPAMQGHAEEGVLSVRRGLLAHETTGAEVHRTYFLAQLAEVYGLLRQPEAGLGVLDKALEVMGRNDERVSEAEIHRLRGELILRRARGGARPQSEAEACFRRALEVARSQEAKALELRAALSLGRLQGPPDSHGERRRLLAATHAWFTEGFETADLRSARALLEDLA